MLYNLCHTCTSKKDNAIILPGGQTDWEIFDGITISRVMEANKTVGNDF